MGTTEDGLKTLYIIASYRQFLQKKMDMEKRKEKEKRERVKWKKGVFVMESR